MSNFNLVTDARLVSGTNCNSEQSKVIVTLCTRWMIVLSAIALTACAGLNPAIDEVNEQPGRQLVLIVEEAQSYTPPINMQSGGTGIALLDIVGGLAALSIESRYEDLHKQLNAQAKNAQLQSSDATPNAHFLKLLQSRLQAIGLRVETRSSPFKLTGIGTSGREYIHPAPNAPVNPQELAYGLRLDVGNCSLSRTIPCIRYSWTKLTKADAAAPVKVYFRHLKTVPIIPRKQELQELLPGYRAGLPQSDEDIRAFDQALHQLVDQAVEQLLKDIRGEKS
jgi:hypothetical protein